MAVAPNRVALFATPCIIARTQAMSASTEKHTVSMHFVRAAVTHCRAEARERALVAAGIASSLVEVPNARVPSNAYSALWLAVARELDDEFFGLDTRKMKVGSFAFVCQAALSCSDIDRATRRILRGFGLFLDQVKGELRLQGSDAVVSIRNDVADPEDRRFADETLLILIHGLLCWLSRRRIPLTRVAFAHPRPVYAKEYKLMFCDAISFGAPQTAMHFTADALGAPVLQTPATLEHFLRSAPQSVFLKYRNEDSWTARVRQHLRERLARRNEWPRLEDVAAQLRTTPTTLRRRLEAEGTSYQVLKDALRNDMAIDHLCNGSLSVDEIAARVGYTDASAFHRAFKRWNGLQPGEYRRLQERE